MSAKTANEDEGARVPFCVPHFYLNIVLLNKDEVIANKVKEKTGSGFFGRAAAAAANSLVTDEALINKLTESLTTKIPQAVGEMGISATMATSYQHKSYAVVRIQINEVDKHTLLKAAKGQEFIDKFETMLGCFRDLGITQALDTVNNTILTKVREGIMSKLGEIIPSKMAEAGLQVSCCVKSREDQADFFYETISSMK